MKIKLNDTITVRPGFGRSLPCKAQVLHMEVTKQPRAKHGIDAAEVDVKLVRQNRVLFTVRYEGADSDNWCYSDQVDL